MDNRIKSMLVNRGIYEMYHDLEEQDYTGDQEAYQSCKSQLPEKGFTMFSPNNGVGKTTAMNILLKECFLTHRKSVYLIGFPDLIKIYKLSFSGDKLYNTICDCDILGLDDVGKEFGHSEASSDLVRSCLDQLLRYRYQRNKPTVVTTNLSLEAINQRYGKDIKSLFYRIGPFIKFSGVDMGKEQHEEISSSDETRKKSNFFK
jgi:DNA replication protein DnaC